MSRPRNKRKNFKAGPPAAVNRGDFFKEVSTVNSYLYFTRPYPFNPDLVIGKKGIKTYTEIYRDEQVKAAMLAKQFAVISPGWEVQPAQYEKDSEKGQAEEVAALIQRSFDDMEGAFENKILEMLSAFVYGFSVAEKVLWLIDSGEFSGKIGLKDLKFRNPEGFDFRTDPFGNLLPDGVLQATRPLPAEKFLIYSYRKRFSNLYGDSDLRECYRCYSDDTEILTESGWKNLSAVGMEERVATLNPATGALEYQYPTKLYSYPYTGKMFHQGGRFIDFLVTPNHEMWAKGESEKEHHAIRADELPRHANYKRNAKWVGNEPAHFDLPEFSHSFMMSNQFVRDHTERRYLQSARNIPIESWLRLFGIWVAEGFTWQRKDGTKQRVVGITQNAGPKLETIKQWVTDCGFSFYEHKDKRGIDPKVTLEITNAQLFQYLRGFGGSHDKFIPHELKQLSPRLLRILYDAMMLGDGRHDRDYCTVSKRLADDVSEIVFKMGYAATVFKETSERFGSSIWIVSRNERRIDRTRVNEHKDQREWLDYDGTVYCLEVPNHIVYVRRNGKAAFSRNSFWAKDNLIKFMMITMERYGEPTWVFNIKGAQSRGNVATLEGFMRDIQSKSGLILPDTIEAKPEYPAPQAGAGYLPVLEYLDGLIRAALGMPSLIGPSSTEQKGGSYARAETQYDMFLNLMEYLRADVESNINEQVVKQLVDFNFEITDAKYPQFKFKAISAEEEQRQYDNYLKGLQGKGITKTREDEIFFREKLEIPALPDDYPVSGEITPEMQKEQDTQAKEVHDATIANMEAKAAAPSGGGGFPPSNKPGVKKASEEQEIEEILFASVGRELEDEHDYINTKHLPAGSSKGGEFAPGVGISDGAGATTRAELGKWDGARSDYAQAALDRIQGNNDPAWSGFTITNNGETVGIVSLHDKVWGGPSGGQKIPMLEVDRLATKRLGYGALMMKEVAARAAAKNAGVILGADMAAVGFYDKIGMTKIEPALFWWSKEEALAFAKS